MGCNQLLILVFLQYMPYFFYTMMTNSSSNFCFFFLIRLKYYVLNRNLDSKSWYAYFFSRLIYDEIRPRINFSLAFFMLSETSQKEIYGACSRLFGVCQKRCLPFLLYSPWWIHTNTLLTSASHPGNYMSVSNHAMHQLLLCIYLLKLLFIYTICTYMYKVNLLFVKRIVLSGGIDLVFFDKFWSV